MKAYRFYVSLLVISLFLPTTVFGQGVEKELFGKKGGEAKFFETEEQVVVSASKREQKLSEAPVAMSVINESDLESMNPQSIPDALRVIPGVFVQRVTGGQYEVAIRGNHGFNQASGPTGMYSKRILVLINGRSFFSDMFGGTQWEHLPITMDQIQRIEVVRGPSTALFGGNAASGVVNIITKKPMNVEKQDVDVRVTPGSDDHHSARVFVPGSFAGWNYTMAGSHSEKERFNYQEFDINRGVSLRFDPLNQGGTCSVGNNASAGSPGCYDITSEESPDFVDGRGDANNSDFPEAGQDSLESDRFNLTLQKELESDRTLMLSGGFADGHMNFAGSSAGLTISRMPTQQHYTKFSVKGERNKVPYEVQGSWISSRLGNNPDGGAGISDGTQGGFKVDSYDMEVQSTYEWSEDDILVSGVNMRNITAESALYFRNQRKVDQDFIGYYFNNEHTFNDELKLVTAGRLDDYDEPDDSAFSPQAIFIYQPEDEDNRMWRLNYSESIRAPFVTDLFVSAPSGASSLFPRGLARFEGDPNLDIPEIRSLELGFRDKFKDKYQVNVNLYRSEHEDSIRFFQSTSDLSAPLGGSDVGTLLRFGNSSRTLETTGAELQIKNTISKDLNPFDEEWKSRLSYTVQNEEFDDGRNLETSPSHLVAWNISGPIEKWNLSLTGRWTDKSRASITNAFDRNTELKAGFAGAVADCLADNGSATRSACQSGVSGKLVQNGVDVNANNEIESYVNFDLSLERPFKFGKRNMKLRLSGEHLGEDHREMAFGEKLEPVYRFGVSSKF